MFALDLGAATASAAIVGRLDGRRRLLASVALPAGTDSDDLLGYLVSRLTEADPITAAQLGLGAGAVAEWPRLTARSISPPLLIVLATSRRMQRAVGSVAGRAGWRVHGLTIAEDDTIELIQAALDPAANGIAVVADETASREEQPAVAELMAIAGGISERRSNLPIVLVGAAALEASSLPAAGESGWLYAPAFDAGEPPGEPLRRLFDRLDPTVSASRRAILRAAVDLAAILDRRVELVEIGLDAGLRVLAGPSGIEGPPAIVPQAGLVPAEITDELVDGVLAWSTLPLDRHRMRDRLRELRSGPWVEAHGEAALLRLAAARAALERLVLATPEITALPAPDLVLVSGGAWAAAPGPAIALAVVDVLRRPGASQLMFDHARLLAPLGTIQDPDERRALLGELADDLLAPLGTAIVPQGLRAGRTAGRLTVRGPAGKTELELIPGSLQLVDLPPGQVATADLHFRDPVDLPTRARHVAIEVGGGLGGLLVDLRDVPLRLPDRADRRRSLLAGWQTAFWTEGER